MENLIFSLNATVPVFSDDGDRYGAAQGRMGR